MITIQLPDSYDIRRAHERGVLALLDAALVVADQILHVEYPYLKFALNPDDPERPPDLVTAHLLVNRIRELQSLLGLHGAAVRAMRHENEAEDDIPF
jgi:hypothetical protein